MSLFSSLVYRCMMSDLEGVEAALQSGIDVNTKYEYGQTLLMGAVQQDPAAMGYRKIKLLELLLSVPNIDVNITDIWGQSALHRAVNNKNHEALKLLLDVPIIDVNKRDNQGMTGLMLAVTNHHNSVVELLKAPNIDVNMKTACGDSLLHLALGCAKYYNIETFKLLLNHPSLTTLTLNHKNKVYGETPVMHAVIRKKKQHLALLIADLRVDMDTTDMEGRSLEERAR